jgi:N-acetylglucosaminyl-diphospho-decaprenol L-rhamnosyltransferase
MRLFCIIVNYRTAPLTLRVARHLLEHVRHLDAELVVVENDSQDGSFELLSEAIQNEKLERVTVLASPENGGFGYGINVGVRHALSQANRPDYIYILNSDAFPDPGAVDELIAYLERSPRVGIAGSYIHGMKGEAQGAAFRFPTVLGELENTLKLGPVSRLLASYRVSMPVPESNLEVDWVSGASMMVRTEVFETAGLFDEGFFLYYEEIDFCRRAREIGLSSAYVASSSISHVGSVSTGMQDVARPMPEYWFASRRRYFAKHHGKAYLAACDLVWAASFAVWRARRRLQHKPDADRPGMLRDFVRYNFPRSFAGKPEARSR